MSKEAYEKIRIGLNEALSKAKGHYAAAAVRAIEQSNARLSGDRKTV